MGFAWRFAYNVAKSDLLLFTEIRKMLNPDQDLTAFIENPDFIIQQALPFSPGNAALHTSGGQPRAARPGLVGLFIVEGHYKEFGLSSLSSGMLSPKVFPFSISCQRTTGAATPVERQRNPNAI